MMFRAGSTVLSVILGVSIAAAESKPPAVAPKPAPSVPDSSSCTDCWVRLPRRPETAIRLTQNGNAETSSNAIPEPLPPTENASPLPSPAENAVLAELLRQYLPEASAEERSVWADELRHYPLEIARDLLAARRKLGEPRALFPSTTPGVVPPLPQEQMFPIPTPLTNPKRLEDTDEAVERTVLTLRQIAALHRHNIANAGSIGFKRLRPLTFEATDLAGLEGFAVQRIDAQGELEATGRPLDLSIEGAGYFQIRGGDSIALTRRGTFTVTAIGELAIKVGNSMWSLYPTVSIPREVTEVTVDENGAVLGLFPGGNEKQIGQIELARVSDASTLESTGAGLLAVPDLSGAVATGMPGDAGFGTIRQATLELSNVDVLGELQALQRVQQQIDALEDIGRPQLAGPAEHQRHH